MGRLKILLLAALFIPVLNYGQTLDETIDANLPSNSTRSITAADLRSTLKTIVDSLQNIEGGGGGGISDAVNDNKYYTRRGQSWTEADQNSITKFRNPEYYLTHYYADLIRGYYDPDSGNVNILVLGDSYGTHYARRLKYESADIYGYGGGMFSGNHLPKAYYDGEATYKQYDYMAGDFVADVDYNDSLNWMNRNYYAVNNGDQMILSAKKFDRVKIVHRSITGDGDFVVKLGVNGSNLLTVDAATYADSTVFQEVVFGKVCQYPFDTVYIETTSTDTVKLYSVGLLNESYNEDWDGDITYERNASIAVHDVFDGGNTPADFYTNKDTAYIRSFLTDNEISLLIYASLEANGADIRETDSLLTLMSYIKPDMSIMLICPNDEQNNYGYTNRYYLDSLAQAKSWAYIDFNNFAGSFENLADPDYGDGNGTNLIGDSTHFNRYGDYLTWFMYDKYLFPKTNDIRSIRTEELMLMDGRINVPNSYSIYINSAVEGDAPLAIKYNYNVGIGYSALKNIDSTGTYNMAIGHQALMENTTGDFNCAMGSLALDANTTGGNNTAVGRSALTSNVSGSDNTVIGSQAGRLIEGDDNVAIGSSALFDHTGSDAVGIGTNAGANNTAGYSVFIGTSSGLNITSGAGNTIIGGLAFAGASAGDSDNNVSIGYQSAYGAGEKNQNTVIGYQAGRGLTTADGNVLLGYKSGYDLTTEDDQLYIANDEDNGAKENTWIYGDGSYNVEIPNGTLTATGGFFPRVVNYATSMNADVAGTVGEIVFCETDNIFYGCTQTGAAGSALWGAFN